MNGFNAKRKQIDKKRFKGPSSGEKKNVSGHEFHARSKIQLDHHQCSIQFVLTSVCQAKGLGKHHTAPSGREKMKTVVRSPTGKAQKCGAVEGTTLHKTEVRESSQAPERKFSQ